jgi:hypothetical protein
MRSVVGRCPMDVGGPRRPAQATSSGRAGGPRAPCTRRLVRARAQHVGRAPAAAPGCPGRSRESVCACPLAAQPPAPLPRSPAGAARRERAPPRAVPRALCRVAAVAPGHDRGPGRGVRPVRGPRRAAAGPPRRGCSAPARASAPAALAMGCAAPAPRACAARAPSRGELQTWGAADMPCLAEHACAGGP